MTNRSTVPMRDWQLLNAFADSELPAAQRAHLQQRLAREPDLAAALGQITALKSDLAGLTSYPSFRPRARWLAVPALAALLLMATLSFVWTTGPSSPEGLRDLHFALSGMAADRIAPMEEPDALDLSASGLALVGGKATEGPEGSRTAWHYRGSNGCALTIIFASELIPEDLPLSRFWHTNGRDYAIIADGMDPTRFDAIARYAKARTGGIMDDGPRIAMRRTTSTATSCS